MRGYHRHGLRITRRAKFPNRLDRHFLSPDRVLSGTIEGDELRLLRARIWMVSQRLDMVKQMVEVKGGEINQEYKTVAVVDEEECTGCGLCYEVCPTGAVSVNGSARIDASKCTACLACVRQCPQEAIAIGYKV